MRPFDRVTWSSRSSGITIPPDVASLLKVAWSEETGTSFLALPEEADSPRIQEGALRQVTVNRYERDGRARKLCVEHYGDSCSVCEIRMRDVYGEVAERLIHVHHLTALAAVGRTHEIDPTDDLRPVCPNCHAVIHLRSPAYSIDEVRSFLTDGRSALSRAR